MRVPILKFYNVKYSRLLAILAALLFILAFSYGYVSVWVLLFSLILAVHFRFLLLRLIDQYSSSESDPAYIAANLYRKLPRVILECAVLTGAVPFFLSVYLSQGTFDPYIISGFDNTSGIFNPIFIQYSLVSISDASAAIAVSLYNQSLFMVIAIFLVAFRPLWKISKNLFIKKPVTGLEKTPGTKTKYFSQYASYDAGSVLYALLVVGMILLLSSKLENLENPLNSWISIFYAAVFPVGVAFSAIFSLLCSFRQSGS